MLTGEDAIGFGVPEFPRRIRDGAACGGIGPEAAEAFFDPSRATEAMRYCVRCPVREACGEWALAERVTGGIYGGMTEHQRALKLAMLIPKQRRTPIKEGPTDCPGCGKHDTVVKHASSAWLCTRCDVRWPSSIPLQREG